jgi:hypothetical protein
MVEITKAGLGRRLRISHTRVTQLLKKGLPILPNGKINLDAALAWIEKNSPAKSKTLLAARGDEVSAPPDDPESLDNFLQSLASGEYPSQAESERAKSAALAGLRILELRRKSGELVELEAASTAFFECAREYRDGLMSWAGAVAPLIAADLQIEDAGAVARVLARHVRDFLATQAEPDAGDLRGDAGRA